MRLKPLARRTLYTLSALLTLLLILLWIRSHFVGQSITRKSITLTPADYREHSASLLSASGQAALYLQYDVQGLAPDSVPGHFTRWESSSYPALRPDYASLSFLQSLGFDFDYDHLPPAWSFWIALPYWLLTPLAASPLLIPLAARYEKRRRTRRGLRPACAYDLRATPTRCPECGTPTRTPTPTPQSL